MASLVEELLCGAGEHGLSIKQLKTKTGLSKNKIKTILFHSKNVKDTDPILHGSFKTKIHVYSFQPFQISYIKRKMIKQNKVVINESRKTLIEQIQNMDSSSDDNNSISNEDDFEDIEGFEII